MNDRERDGFWEDVSQQESSKKLTRPWLQIFRIINERSSKLLVGERGFQKWTNLPLLKKVLERHAQDWLINEYPHPHPERHWMRPLPWLQVDIKQAQGEP